MDCATDILIHKSSTTRYGRRMSRARRAAIHDMIVGTVLVATGLLIMATGFIAGHTAHAF